MKTLNRDGFTLNYDILGESTSGETVLFFNGSLSTMAGWGPLTETLIKDGGRALLHDMRGQLYSPWNKPFSFSDLADDAAAILDKEGLEKAHIAGLSYGSIPAQVFAASYPERAESLILISALSEMDANTEAWVHRFTAWGKAAAADPSVRRDVYKNMSPLFFSPDFAAEHTVDMEKAADAFEQFPREFFEGMVRIFENQLANTPVTGELKKIQCPTLVINAMMDILTPWYLSEIILNNIDNAEAIVIPGAGHAVNNEKPALLDGLLAGFVNRVSLEGKRKT